MQHTCTISLTRTIPFQGDSQVGEGGTSISGDSACTTGRAFIGAEWESPNGQSEALTVEFDGSSTFRRFAPIGDRTTFHAFHDVNFQLSSGGCSANCLFNETRTK